MISEARRTQSLKSNLPRGICIGKFSDGRGKPWFVRYSKGRKCQGFATEAQRNDHAEKLAAVAEKEGMHAIHWDPEEWSAYRGFRARVGLTLAQIEEILGMVKLAGLMLKDRHPGMPDALKTSPHFTRPKTAASRIHANASDSNADVRSPSDSDQDAARQESA